MKKLFLKYFKLICILFIPIVLFSLILEVQVGDELFNFQSVSKMVNGFTIYKDFNVIITPLFFIIGAILQKIFGNYLIVFRLYNILSCFLFYIAFYNILEEVNISKKFRITGLLICFILTMNVIYSGANYSVLATAIYMIGVKYLLKEKNKKTSFILGIVAYLCFMAKQNIGVFFILALIISQIICLKKECIKELFIQSSTFLILILFSIFLFWIKGNFYDFLNYIFFNLADFSNSYFMFVLSEIKPIVVFLIAIVLTNILFGIKIIKEKDKNYYIIFIFSVFLLLSIFPAINMYHIYIGMTCTIVEIIILLDSVFSKIITDENYSEKIKEIKLISVNSLIKFMNCTLYILIILNIAIVPLNYRNHTIEKDIHSPYYLCIINKNTKKDIKEVCNYINNQKNIGTGVIVFSEKACLYTPILKNNNGDFDLPLYRKFWKRGSKRTYKKNRQIKKCKNIIRR